MSVNLLVVNQGQAELIVRLEAENAALKQALREISGELDVDGNSAFCDCHEDCQYRAQKALAATKGELV